MKSPLRFNLPNINFERSERQAWRPGFWGRLITIAATLAGILIVVWLLFNPVRTRPSAAAYIESFNRIAAAQNLPERITATPPDPAIGSREYALDQSGLILTVRCDANGYVTGLALADRPASDQSAPPSVQPPAQPSVQPPIQQSAAWQQLAPQQLRNRFLLMLDALDAKWTAVALYRAFTAMGLDLDQPLAAQPAGTRELASDGLLLALTHDSQHISFQATLDILEE